MIVPCLRDISLIVDALQMKKGTSSALFLDTLIAARAAKRTADRKFQERFDAFFGIYRAEEYTTYPADLVVAANRGDVNGVIDLLDHDVDPVSPNAMNSVCAKIKDCCRYFNFWHN